MAKSRQVPPAPQKKVIRMIPPAPGPEHRNWKKAFYGTLALFTLIAIAGGYNIGFHSDEMDMNAYGKANWKYLSTFGKDTSYKHIKLENGYEVPPVIKTYGGFFEFINSCVQRAAGPFFGGEYNTRHLLCQLMGLLAIWLAGLIAVSLYGRYLYGLCCILLLFLTPTFFGHLMFNTKDIPFTLGYVLSIYGLIQFIKQKAAFKLSPFIFIALGLAACIGTRIGGLVLLAYMLLALGMVLYDRAKGKGASLPVLRKQLLLLGLSLFVGFTLAILPWPFALSSPVKNLQYALDVATKFPQRIPFMFEGKHMDSLTIPSHYLFKWMGITIPIYIILLFFISIIVMAFHFMKKGSRLYLFVLFTVLFPVLYAIQSKAALYSAWRHMLFVYPLMVVLSVYVIHMFVRSSARSYAPYLAVLSCIICLAHPIYWSVKYHPYEYVYFNEVSGGFAANHDRYETDYWQLSVNEAVDWLYENEPVKGRPGMAIGSNAYSVTEYMMRYDHNDKTSKVNQGSYKAKSLIDWKYMVLSSLFLEPYVIQNDFYPPPNTIHRVEIEGKTICAIIRDTAREDYKAYMAITQHQAKLADSLADSYLSKNPGAVKMMEVSAGAKSELSNWNGVYKRCAQGLALDPNNIVLHYYLGFYYANNGEPQGAITNVEGALSLGYEKSKGAYRLLSSCYAMLGNKEKAEYYAKLMEQTKN